MSSSRPTVLVARDKKDEAAPDEEACVALRSGLPYFFPDLVVDGGGGGFVAPHGSESEEELELDIGSVN